MIVVPQKIQDLTALALKDRVMTYTERQTIVKAALEMGVAPAVIDEYLKNALDERMRHFTKEELSSCPHCNSPLPIIANDCPYCGSTLQNNYYRVANVSGSEAAIINRENRITQEERTNIKACPKCGAPFPLVSNLCGHCGFVLHEIRQDYNISNLIRNIEENIRALKGTLRPSFGLALKFRLNTLFFYFAAAFYIIFVLNDNITMLMVSAVCLFLAFLLVSITNKGREAEPFPDFYFSIYWVEEIILHYLFGVQSTASPIEVADTEFYNALHRFEMFQRQVDTIYGDSREAKQRLAEYAAEINGYKTTRAKCRRQLAALFIGLLAIPFVIYFFTPTQSEVYSESLSKCSNEYAITDFSKRIKPVAHKGIYDYLTVNDSADIKIDLLNRKAYLEGFDYVHYIIRISGVNLLSTGKIHDQADTLNIIGRLLDKDGNKVGGDFPFFKPILRHRVDNYHTLMANGNGHVYCDFYVKSPATSPQRFKEIADSACYFLIF